MLYELELYVLITVLVFSTAGLATLCLWLWDEARELLAVRRRIYARLPVLTTESRIFANPLAISRTVSRNPQGNSNVWHSYQ
jgi:hypothetical protein